MKSRWESRPKEKDKSAAELTRDLEDVYGKKVWFLKVMADLEGYVWSYTKAYMLRKGNK